MDVVEPAVVMTGSSPGQPQSSDVVRRVTLAEKMLYLLLAGACRLASALPTGWVTAAGATCVGLIGPWLRQNKRALANLEIAFPDKSAAERAAIARAMWANMGRTYAESLIFPRFSATGDAIEIVEEDRWRPRMSEPVPQICCTLHMGSWELAIEPLRRFGRRPAGVYRPLGNPLIDRWLVATRAPMFPGGLLAKGDNDEDVRAGQRTARRLIDMARKGGAIGFVCDHFDRRGEPIAFLGRHAKFTTAPAMIARHVGARVYVGACLRQGTSSRFRMVIEEIEVPRTDDKAADAITLTTAIFAAFERWIRAHPEQWMWWNTRWVTAGVPDQQTAGR